ncbi:MAG: transcriptional regulator [Proteobacteria bacterium]|nr:transcriptional regulator [Pseudomonadota bacterium]
MPLTRPFKETIMVRLQKRPEFRQAMLREAIDAFLTGEIDVGKSMLRDYINGTIGFEKLSKKVKIPSKSLMRMFGPNGNPRANNLFAVIEALQRETGVELHLAAE